MLDTSNPNVQLKITSVVCSSVAVVTTCHRLWVRRGRYWLDDAWAFFAFICLLVQVAAVFMHVDDPTGISRTNRVASYYLMAETFYAVIWGSRQAILFSIIRIDPNPRTRRVLYGVSVLFGLATIVLMVQLFWVCEPQKGWKDMPSPQCQLDVQVAICQLVSDIVADLILLISPIRLLRSLDNKALRRKLMIIFSTCIVTTIVSLVHAAYILRRAGIKVIISAIVEDCMSLIVANIPVVVTQIVHLREDHNVKRGRETAPSTFMQFASRILGVKSTALFDHHQQQNHSESRTRSSSGGRVYTMKKEDQEASGDTQNLTHFSMSFGMSDFTDPAAHSTFGTETNTHTKTGLGSVVVDDVDDDEVFRAGKHKKDSAVRFSSDV